MWQRGDRPPCCWQQYAAGTLDDTLGHTLGCEAIEPKRQVWAVPFQRAPRHIGYRRDGHDCIKLFRAQFRVAAPRWCVCHGSYPANEAKSIPPLRRRAYYNVLSWAAD